MSKRNHRIPTEARVAAATSASPASPAPPTQISETERLALMMAQRDAIGAERRREACRVDLLVASAEARAAAERYQTALRGAELRYGKLDEQTLSPAPMGPPIGKRPPPPPAPAKGGPS